MTNSPFDSYPAARSADSIRESLLRRAFAQGRGEEMRRTIAEIDNRVAQMPPGHAVALQLAKMWDGMARGVRMLNTEAVREGKPIFFSDNAADYWPGPGGVN